MDSIAVIIPTFNRRERLCAALDSVLAQTCPADEICVVDDGSRDGTADMLRQRYPDVHCLVQENRGVSAARNAGVRATHSQWLAFLDSDDVWMPDKLARQREAWQKESSYQLVHCDEIWVRNGVRVNPMRKHAKAGGNVFRKCLPLCVISPSAVLLTRELFTGAGGFDETLPACEDYDLWLRICCTWPVLFVNQPLLSKFGGHDDQLSRRYWGMDRFRVRALVKLLDTGMLSAEQAHAARAMLRKKCRILINGARKRGNTKLLDDMLDLQHKYSMAMAS